MACLPDYIEVLLSFSKWCVEKIKNKKYDPPGQEALSISVIKVSWSALEAFINHIASLAKYARGLKPHEKAFLNEKKMMVDDDGEFREFKEYASTTKKYLFLLYRFSPVKNRKFRKTRLWDDIKKAEIIRDSLIHPKENISLDNFSSKNALFVYQTVRDAMIYLNKKTLKSKTFNF